MFPSNYFLYSEIHQKPTTKSFPYLPLISKEIIYQRATTSLQCIISWNHQMKNHKTNQTSSPYPNHHKLVNNFYFRIIPSSDIKTHTKKEVLVYVLLLLVCQPSLLCFSKMYTAYTSPPVAINSQRKLYMVHHYRIS